MTTAAATTRVLRYAPVAVALHWIIAVFIVGQIAAGWWMTGGEGAAAAAPGTLRFAVFQLHKTFGILVLLLSVARIVWRLMNPPPPSHVIVLPWEKALASSVYAAFYVLMIALPLTGWALVSSSPTGFPTLLFGVIEWPHLPLPAEEGFNGVAHEVHEILAWVAVALIALHIAGALKHQLVDHENILVRIAPGLFGRAEASGARARGLIAVAAVPLALAAVVLAAPLAVGGGASAPQLAPASSGPGLWAVNPETSSIAFAGTQSGTPFEGRFAVWTAEIVFDPADPASAHLLVTIDATSIETADIYVKSSIQSSSWLDTRAYPQATFEATGFSVAGPGAYEALGRLTLKGATQPVVLPFTLSIEGDLARAQGSVALDRRAFEIGTDTNENDAAVSPEITVTVTVEATRAAGA